MQTDIAVLLIEDEEVWAQKTAYDLNSFGYTVVNNVDNFDEALAAIHQNNYDIVLLDINLNGKNSGIELGKIISFTAQKPFIFVTGSMESSIITDAVAAKPSAYLTKPVTPASLFVSIQSAIHHFHSGLATTPAKSQENHTDFFFVKHGKKYKKIDWDEVICLRSERNYTCVITREEETFLIRSSLQKAIRDIVPASYKDKFMQINRAEMLQITFIDELNNDEAIIGSTSFNITEAYLKPLKQQLNIVL